MPYDYRQSHLADGKGESYSKGFWQNPHRRMIWQMEQEVLGKILKHFCQDRDIRHLDFACGTGRILEYMENYQVVSSVGVDVSPSMLKVARQRVKHARIIEADVTRTDVLGDRNFDLITAFRFFPNAQPQLRMESMQVLTKHLDVGGRIIFNNHINHSSALYRLRRLLRRHGNGGMSQTNVDDVVTSAGLIIEEVHHIGVIPSTERHLVLPSKVLGVMERALSHCTMLRGLAQNLVFVCKRQRDVVGASQTSNNSEAI